MKVKSTNLNQPHFMAGLKYARGILLQLKSTKLRKAKERQAIAALSPQKGSSPAPSPQSKIQTTANNAKTKKQDQKQHEYKQEYKQDKQDQSRQKDQKMKEPTQKEQITEKEMKKRDIDIISEKINALGLQLQQAYTQQQTYQSIFNQLAEYYHAHYPLVEEGELLKEYNLKMKREIQQYNSKVDEIKQKIAQTKEEARIAKQQLNQAIGEYLKQFTIQEQYQHLPQVDKHQFIDQLISSEQQIHKVPSTEIKYTKISLNYKKMKEEAVKKPPTRKSKPVTSYQESSSIDKFYQSQMYSL